MMKRLFFGGVILVAVTSLLAGAQAAGASTGLLTITSDTVLTEDHQGQIRFDADNVSLDCHGHSVEGTGTYGIAVIGRSHVTIRNCHVSGFGTGIGLERTTYSLVEGNTSSDNINQGIASYGSSENTFSNNVVARNLFGFYVTPMSVSGPYSEHNGFVGNTASENRWDGFALVDFQDSTLVANTASGNQGLGFDLWRWNQGAASSTIRDNVSTENTFSGFGLTGSSHNTLDGNQSANNGATGFYLRQSYADALDHNTATGHEHGYGFLIQDSTNVALMHNVATDSGDTGFYFVRVSGGTVAHNSASGGGYAGFWLQESSGGTFTNNAANGNANMGFYLYQSSGTFEHNLASDNWNGIFLWTSSGSTFTHNVTNTNHAYGFALNGSNNKLSQNVANENGMAGFVLFTGSTANTIERCVAHDNSTYDALDSNPPGANAWTHNSFGVTSPAGLG